MASDWYYLKHRKPVQFKHSIIGNVEAYLKEVHKHKRARKRVRHTYLNGYLISTVFLGLDHSFNDSKPLLFETMIFKGGSFSDLYCDRCSTWREALAMHRKAKEIIKNNQTSELYECQ